MEIEEFEFVDYPSATQQITQEEKTFHPQQALSPSQEADLDALIDAHEQQEQDETEAWEAWCAEARSQGLSPLTGKPMDHMVVRSRRKLCTRCDTVTPHKLYVGGPSPWTISVDQCLSCNDTGTIDVYQIDDQEDQPCTAF